MSDDFLTIKKDFSEADVRKRITGIFKINGFKHMAVEATTPLGFPDNLYVKEGLTVYVEMKKLKNLKPEYRPGQLPTLLTLRKHGAPAYVGVRHNDKYYLLPPKEKYYESDFIEASRIAPSKGLRFHGERLDG